MVGGGGRRRVERRRCRAALPGSTRRRHLGDQAVRREELPGLLLFNASQATFRRYRGDFTADALRALASDGAGALPEEPIRPASEEFELVQRASGAGLVSTKAMSMGVTIAALLFLLGVCVGCVCSLRLVAVVLTCGLCGRERQRKRGEKKD